MRHRPEVIPDVSHNQYSMTRDAQGRGLGPLQERYHDHKEG
jgi:hypothetical protein